MQWGCRTLIGFCATFGGWSFNKRCSIVVFLVYLLHPICFMKPSRDFREKFVILSNHSGSLKKFASAKIRMGRIAGSGRRGRCLKMHRVNGEISCCFYFGQKSKSRTCFLRPMMGARLINFCRNLVNNGSQWGKVNYGFVRPSSLHPSLFPPNPNVTCVFAARLNPPTAAAPRIVT